MFVSHKALNDGHQATEFFRRGEERNWHRLEEEEVQAGTEMTITSYEIPLNPFNSFNYLERGLSAADDY